MRLSTAPEPAQACRKEALLARRKALQVWTLVARRERYGEMTGVLENTATSALKTRVARPAMFGAVADQQ